MKSSVHMKTVALPSGEAVPALGLGTWHMGENPANTAEEISCIQMAIDLGASLIDTAEVYGNGKAETLVGKAIEGRRDDVFLVTKAYPDHASLEGMPIACERSLERLNTDWIDLYLLHWRGSIPLEETVQAFTELQEAGTIRHFGVSNFDLDDMQELWSIPGGSDVATDQVLYNLSRRGIEWDLLPWLRKRHVPVMAYSPIEQARLVRNPKLIRFAQQIGRTAVQVALAWLLAKDDVIAIPKTSNPERLKENLGALDHPLNKEQLAELDRLFPPPDGPRPLEMI
ncbi:MAG: aldo/keto reductase [Pedosphaera sp.]|nr:aldo/keto reductase [Pedosphaera sp.]